MSAFQKIDTSLGQYYQALGEYDYFDNNGIGRFLRFCEKNGFEDDDVDEELADGNAANCGFIEFDEDFPWRAPIENASESEKQSEIFRVLQHCHKYGYPPILTAEDIGIEPWRNNVDDPKTGKPGKKKRKFKFASPGRARRFVLDISNFDDKKEAISPNANIQSFIDDGLTDLERFCAGIGRYYYSMRRNDYYDIEGIGKFTKWFESEEMDINDMKEELIDGTMDDCSYLDFDKDDDNKTNGFPLPTDIDGVVILNENDRSQKQFEIMVNIFRYGKPPQLIQPENIPTIDPYSINFDINKEDENRARKLYEIQCPRLIRCFENEKDLMKLLAISYCNNNIPFTLWMVDCFMRDRLIEYITNNKRQITVNQWTQNMDKKEPFGITQYVNRLKKKYIINNGKHDIVTCLQHGIKAYIYRILPQFKFDIFCLIRDDLFAIAHYFEAASQFVMKIINEDDAPRTPFQWDFCIAVRDVTDKKGNILIPDGADPADLNDDTMDDNKDNEYYDIIGDLKEKLKNNKCAYYISEVNTHPNNNRLKDNLLIRCFKMSYDSFKRKNDLMATKNDNKYNLFPRMRRFCTLIDRRNHVTISDELECQSSNDDDINSECQCHEIQDRNNDGTKKDDIYFWIPPKNADKLPHDGINGKLAEVYFDNLSKCVIPRIGYVDNMNNNDHFNMEDTIGMNKSTKCRLLRSTITNNCTNNGILLFSFQIESIDEIRCYFWWNGTCVRFRSTDIIDILPLIFDLKYQNNDRFMDTENIKDLIHQIAFRDRCFEAWYRNISRKQYDD